MKDMKKIAFILVASISLLCLSSCHKDLLNQTPTGELASSQFWKTQDDATYALNGCYTEVRRLFDRDYMFDGLGEYLRYRASGTTSQSTGDRAIAYRSGTYNNPSTTYGSSYTNYYSYGYAGINRCNYVIQNVEAMLETATNEAALTSLKGIIGEARMMRGMIYFRLISMFGDIPYFDKIINSNDEVADITRTPIAEIY